MSGYADECVSRKPCKKVDKKKKKAEVKRFIPYFIKNKGKGK